MKKSKNDKLYKQSMEIHIEDLKVSLSMHRASQLNYKMDIKLSKMGLDLAAKQETVVRLRLADAEETLKGIR